MRLTKYSDFALRTLIYLALAKRRCTIDEITESYSIPKNHLIKVVNQLSSLGYIDSTRGKGGGIDLAHHPQDIYLGDVVRATEQNFNLVECFSSDDNECVLSPSCKLAAIFSQALEEFLSVLDKHTLDDVVSNKMKVLLQLG